MLYDDRDNQVLLIFPWDVEPSCMYTVSIVTQNRRLPTLWSCPLISIETARSGCRQWYRASTWLSTGTSHRNIATVCRRLLETETSIASHGLTYAQAGAG